MEYLMIEHVQHEGLGIPEILCVICFVDPPGLLRFKNACRSPIERRMHGLTTLEPRAGTIDTI